MTGTVIPINQSQRRLPQAGRIRIGVQVTTSSGKTRPGKLDTFRFTSQDASYLRSVASVYGGDVKEFPNAKSPDRFEVITKAKQIAVVLPPDPISEQFEKWDGKEGLQRRCNGVTCDLAVSGPEGADRSDVPCICDRKGVLECKYLLRVSFLLPEVSTLSTWRLDTSSANARAEIPGMVDVIEMLQGRGLHHATLRLEQRTSPGHRFNVPVLDAGVSVGALEAGDQRMGALPEPEAPRALTVAPDPDDEVIEAEVVYERVGDITGEQPPVDPDLARSWVDSLTTHQKSKALLRARVIARELGEPEPTNAAAISVTVIDRLMQEMQP